MTILQFPTKPHVENYFGGCPVCGDTDGFLNIGSDHWFVCHGHKTKWWAGSNLFSCWRDEPESEWQHNWYLLANYRNVEPLPMTLSEAEREAEREADERWRQHEEEIRAVDKGYGVVCGPNGIRALGPDEDPFDEEPF